MVKCTYIQRNGYDNEINLMLLDEYGQARLIHYAKVKEAILKGLIVVDNLFVIGGKLEYYQAVHNLGLIDNYLAIRAKIGREKLSRFVLKEKLRREQQISTSYGKSSVEGTPETIGISTIDKVETHPKTVNSNFKEKLKKVNRYRWRR